MGAMFVFLPTLRPSSLTYSLSLNGILTLVGKCTHIKAMLHYSVFNLSVCPFSS